MKKKNKAPPPPATADQAAPVPAQALSRFSIGDKPLFLILFVLFAVIVFRDVLSPGRILFTTDDNIGALAGRKFPMPHSFFGYWDDGLLIGQANILNLNWTNLLLWLLPLNFFNNWIHGIDLVVASFAFCLFLRLRRLHPVACVLGALVAFWLGSTFFLVYAGHIGKFGAVMFAALYLWLSEAAVLRKSLPYAVLAGGAMGGMILEQADSGFFFAMALGCYTLYSIHREYGWNVVLMVKLLAAIVLVFSVVSYRPLTTAMGIYSLEKKEANLQNAQENWDYCTQWGWPPEETIDFVAPGYTGWRSGEPEGPYWGRMGRSAQWETTKQGFQNFKLETFYLGAIPIVLAFWAMVLVAGRWNLLAEQRRDILAWTAVALVTYLLALGKFCPLYALFYKLPGMASIRNPVKFMQVTQLALATLAAFGLDAWIRYLPDLAADDRGKQIARRFVFTVLAIGILFALWSSGMSSSTDKVASRFAAMGWGNAARTIADTMIAAVQHASIMTLFAGAMLALGVFVPLVRTKANLVLAAWILTGAAAADQLVVSPRYVNTVTAEGFIRENAAVKFLRNELQGQRPYLVSQTDFYNLWLTYTFPYFHIPSLNVTQMRMTDDYKRFLGAMNDQPFKLWQASAASFIMGPGGALSQLQNDPRGKDQYDIAFAFNAYPAFGGGVDVTPGTPSSPGQHGILKFRGLAARYQFVAGWEVVDDEEALRRLPSEEFKLFSKVLVSTDTGIGLPASDSEGPVGSVQIEQYRSGRVQLKTSCERLAILRVADKYAPQWNAYIDGDKTRVLRCDYIYQGVSVPPGLHTVVLAYEPGNTSLWVQAAGMLACVAALVSVAPWRRREPAHP
ncbi:MAG: hypothetical protein V1929_02305 [bacterium]